MLVSTPESNNKAIAIWLFVCCALIFTMVVLGGVTRLTRSGLSMVEWDPIMGVVPPLNQEQWQNTFDKYKNFPEYQKINKGMNLSEFKAIFWFEYSHRLLGRAIGLVFFIPFMYFLVRKKIRADLLPKLIIMFVLGGLQGLLGWYMVKSGLVDNPHVSQYRLTAHLVMAIGIYGFMFWVALGLLMPRRSGYNELIQPGLKRFGLFITAVISLMIISGGFVAGTKAGFAFNTFPKMHGQWVPGGMFTLSPWIINFFENIATIQFTHRIIALMLFILVPAYWVMALRLHLSKISNRGFHLLLLILLLQIILGISTLLLHVPVSLAAAHQAGALVLLTLALFLNYRLR